MSLLDRFMQNIADICDIDVRLIQQDGNKILVDSYEFPFLGVFFNEDPEEPSAIQFNGSIILMHSMHLRRSLTRQP